MYRIGLMLLVLLPRATTVDEGRSAATAKELTATEQLQALKKEINKKQRAVRDAYARATTKEEKAKALRGWPKTEEYAEKSLSLAEKFPKDPAAIPALIWAVQISDGRVCDQALDLLIRDHIDSDQLAEVPEVLIYSRSTVAERALRILMAKSPHHKVRGYACYGLAQYLGNKANSKDASPAERDTCNKKRLPLLDQVIARYSDVKFRGESIAELARGDLFEVKHLSIGMVAPEIEGKDLEGKPFTLSDYRGKVVLLDFWGNW